MHWAARAALEAGVTAGTFTERLAQRAAGWWRGDVAELAVADEAVMEDVSCSATAAEVMTVNRVAFAAGRCVVAVAGVAVAGPEGGCMLLVERAARAALEAVVADDAFAVGLAQRAAGNTGDMAAFAVVDEAVMELVS